MEGKRLHEIRRKGMYIAQYNERSFGSLVHVTKMCTKKQFLKELAGKDPDEIAIICRKAIFYPI